MTETEPSSQPPIRFRGEITPDAERDLHILYSQGNRVALVGRVLASSLLVAFAVRGGNAAIAERLFFMSSGLVLLFATLLGPILAWNGWWPAFLKRYGRQIAGELSAEGPFLAGTPSRILWSDFVQVKSNEKAVLLYVNKADAFPLHRELFESDEAWTAARRLIEKGSGKPLDR